MSFHGALSHILWPQSCPLCGRLSKAICPDCLIFLVEKNNPVCLECFRPLPCDSHGKDALFLVFGALHKKEAKRLVHMLKYEGHKALGRPLGRAVALTVNLPKEVDCIVPVPLHRKSGRPFNQALEIARGVSEILKVPVKEELEWTGGEKPQVGKASLERKQLSAGALRLSGKITGTTARSVLLVDDVCTTGTTLRRCAEALRRGTLHVTGALVWTLSA